MKVYREAELKRAYELQDELAKLHIPVPVTSWRAKITENDNIIEEYKSKCNSYTRNGLNLIASEGSYPANTIYTELQASVAKKLDDTEYWYRQSTEFNGCLYFKTLVTSLSEYRLRKYNIVTGELTTIIAVTGVAWSSLAKMVVDNNSLYFPAGAQIYKINSDDTYELITTAAGIVTSMAVNAGIVYYFIGSAAIQQVENGVTTSIGAAGTWPYRLMWYNGDLYCVLGGNGTVGNRGTLKKWTGGTTWVQVAGDFTSSTTASTPELFIVNGQMYMIAGGITETTTYIWWFNGAAWVSQIGLPHTSYGIIINSISVNNNKFAITYYLPSLAYLVTGFVDTDESVKIDDAKVINTPSVNTHTGLLSYAGGELYFASQTADGTVMKANNLNGQITYRDTNGSQKVGSIATTISATLGQEYLELGTSNNAYHIDDYKLDLLVGWTKGSTTRVTSFDTTEIEVSPGVFKPRNTLVTSIVRTFTNSTGVDQVITEAGLYVYLGSPNGSFLTVRDKFEEPITVLAGQTITFEYVMEVAYPQ